MGISKFLSVEGSTDSNLLYQAKTCVPVSNLAHQLSLLVCVLLLPLERCSRSHGVEQQ